MERQSLFRRKLSVLRFMVGKCYINVTMSGFVRLLCNDSGAYTTTRTTWKQNIYVTKCMMVLQYSPCCKPINFCITITADLLLIVHADYQLGFLISNCNQREVFQRLNFRREVFPFPRQFHCSMSVLFTVIFR